MKQVWVILVREYLEKVKTKGFWIATLALPVLMLGLMGVSAFLGVRSQQAEAERPLVVLDRTGALGEAVVDRIGNAGYASELLEADPGIEEMDRRVTDEEIDSYLVLDERTVSQGAFAYRAMDSPSRVRSALLTAVVGEVALENRLAEAEDAENLRALMRGGSMEYEAVGGKVAEVARVAAKAQGMVGAILLYMCMAIYGAFVLRSVMEEKRTRIVDVVISSVRPWQLMLGKILGVGSMGLTQLATWMVCVGTIGTLGIPFLSRVAPAANMDLIAEFVPSAGSLLLLAAFFLLGYFLFSSLFAAVGAMCSREEEAAQAQVPVIALLGIPFVLQMSTAGGASFAWMDWAALFPFFSPILMYPRAVDGSVPVWMVAASIVLMAAAVFAMAWLSGRIYRVGILMQGKRPNLRELYRWVREA